MSSLISANHSLYMEQMSIKNYKLYIGEFAERTNALHEIYAELRSGGSGYDSLEMRVSSTGGFVTEGFHFINIIKDCFKGNTIAYIDAMAYSMGAFLFCEADKRVVYENSSIMFHDWSGGVQGNPESIKDRLRHDEKLLSSLTKDLFKKGFITKEEYTLLKIGKEFWFTPYEMCQRGIATHIMVEGEEFESQEYIEIMAENKKRIKEQKNAIKNSKKEFKKSKKKNKNK